MKPTINEICVFTNSTPSCRNFVEGERILNAGHVIFCGRTSVSNDYINFIAFCLQTSHLKNNPHEITGSISATGKIINAKCSCKAGLSEKCKHSVAVFLHLNRIQVNNLELVSCTDTKCLWKMPHAKSLEKYAPSPLSEHECLTEKFKKGCSILISDGQRHEIDQILVTEIKDSALFKHMSGRHEPLISEVNNNVVDINNTIIEAILEIQPSDSMLNLSRISPNQPEKKCCTEFAVQITQIS